MPGTAGVPPGLKRILVVEDQPDIRRLVQMSLEFEPYELHEAADGETALAMAARLQPDLVLLDVMMPGALDGLQVCARLRADPALQATRIVLLSARTQPEDRQAGLDAGADAYLAKPFSPLGLVEALEQVLAGRA